MQLPEISLGLWHNFGDVDDYGEAKRMIVSAFGHGICHFDLANNYGPAPGSAETNFGRILREELASHRDEMFISSKAGHDMWPGVYGTCSSRKISSPRVMRRFDAPALNISTSFTAIATTG